MSRFANKLFMYCPTGLSRLASEARGNKHLRLTPTLKAREAEILAAEALDELDAVDDDGSAEYVRQCKNVHLLQR